MNTLENDFGAFFVTFLAITRFLVTNENIFIAFGITADGFSLVLLVANNILV